MVASLMVRRIGALCVARMVEEGVPEFVFMTAGKSERKTMGESPGGEVGAS